MSRSSSSVGGSVSRTSRGDLEVPAGVLTNLIEGHAGVQALQRHLAGLVESVDAEAGHHDRRPLPLPLLRPIAAEVPGAGHEVDRVDERALGLRHDDEDLLGVDRDLARAARARQPHLRLARSRRSPWCSGCRSGRSALRRGTRRRRARVPGSKRTARTCSSPGATRSPGWDRRSTAAGGRARRRRRPPRRAARCRARPFASPGCTRCSAARRPRSTRVRRPAGAPTPRSSSRRR